MQFGLQDKKQEVHPGTKRRDGSTLFEFELQPRGKPDGPPDFGGAFVHGTPGARFLYLSWKRTPGGPAPWVQRIKIPLGSINWEQIREAEKADGFIEADVTGRRPHDTRPVIWKHVRGR